MGRDKFLKYVCKLDWEFGERKWESKRTGMGKHNRTCTGGNIDQVPEIEITWN